MGKLEKTPPDTPKDLESAMGKLDGLLSEMEDGKLPLEELIGRYEEGVRLVRFCQERLEAAEERIQAITKQADGALAAQPFEAPENE